MSVETLCRGQVSAVGFEQRLMMSWSLLQLAALEFPPKKLFGNRDERMVAERRNHLEARHFNTVLFTCNKDKSQTKRWIL